MKVDVSEYHNVSGNVIPFIPDDDVRRKSDIYIYDAKDGAMVGSFDDVYIVKRKKVLTNMKNEFYLKCNIGKDPALGSINITKSYVHKRFGLDSEMDFTFSINPHGYRNHYRSMTNIISLGFFLGVSFLLSMTIKGMLEITDPFYPLIAFFVFLTILTVQQNAAVTRRTTVDSIFDLTTRFKLGDKDGE